LIDEAVDLGIFTAVEPNIGIVGACLPLMAPIFRKVRKFSTKKSHGDSSDKTWPHTRLQEYQTEAPQQHCPTSSNVPQAAYTKSDGLPFTSHREWTNGGSDDDDDDDDDLRQQAQRHIEMQTLPEVALHWPSAR
jgi:hypothetical protein